MPVVKHRSHNERILKAQERYHQGDKTALAEMYELFREMAFNMIRDYFGRKKIHHPKYEIESKAHDMASDQIALFIKYENYKIEKSPSGLLRNGVFMRVMYGDKKHDKTRSLDEVIKGELCQ